MKRPCLLLVLASVILPCIQSSAPRQVVAEEMPPARAISGPEGTKGDFIAFYPKVPSMMEKAPDLSLYNIDCSVPVDKWYFTLARTKDGGSALFVVTGRRVTRLLDAISFGGPGKSRDWGFVYDRNGDGSVDYFAFLLGAMPVETPAMAQKIPKYPKPKPGEGIPATPEGIALMMENTRLVFIHHADDNFDGKADAIVSALQDPDRWGWIDRRAVLRSRSYSQTVDEDWTFVEDINVRTGPVPRTEDGRFEKLEGLAKTEGHLEASSRMFDSINSWIRACNLPKGALPRE